MEVAVLKMGPGPDKVLLEEQLRLRSNLRKAYIFEEKIFIQNRTAKYSTVLTNYETLKHIANKLFAVDTYMMEILFRSPDFLFSDSDIVTMTNEVKEYRQRWNEFKCGNTEYIRSAIKVVNIDRIN